MVNRVYRVTATYKDATDSTYELLEDGVGMPDGPVDIPHSEISATEQYAGIMNNGDNKASSTTYWDNFAGGALGGGGSVLPIMLQQQAV